MDFAALRTFLVVAELASFSRAAEQLHVAQPAVSQQIKRLERELGTPLLHRSTRRVQLTEAGAMFQPRAREILAEVQRAEAEVRLLGEGLAGQVAIGFVGTATYDLLPRIARSVRENLPGIELQLYGEQLTPALLEGLHSRRIDIAVTRDPVPEAQLSIHPLRAEKFVVALPVDHPLAGEPAVRLAALRDATFVTHPSGHGSVTYNAVIRACEQAGFYPTEVVEVRETATLVTFVAAGIGVAVVPRPVRSLALAGVVYRELADVTTTTELAVAMRASEVSPAVARVVSLVTATVGNEPGEISQRPIVSG